VVTITSERRKACWNTANHRVDLVADGGVIEDVNAQLLEAKAEPLAVRVEKLPAGDLVPDGDDLAAHPALPAHAIELL
jgi:hypothetical protein